MGRVTRLERAPPGGRAPPALVRNVGARRASRCAGADVSVQVVVCQLRGLMRRLGRWEWLARRLARGVALLTAAAVTRDPPCAEQRRAGPAARADRQAVRFWRRAA
eukprot:1142914-Prymnesium_polylepis.1